MPLPAPLRPGGGKLSNNSRNFSRSGGRARHRRRARMHNRRWPAQRRVAGRGEVIDPDEVEHPRGTCERASACGPSTPCQRPRSHRTGPPRMTHNYKCFHLHTPQSSPMKWWPYEWKILGPRMEHGWNTDSEGKSEMRHKSQPRFSAGLHASRVPIRVNRCSSAHQENGSCGKCLDEVKKAGLCQAQS